MGLSRNKIVCDDDYTKLGEQLGCAYGASLGVS